MDADIVAAQKAEDFQRIRLQDERDNRKVMQAIAKQQADLNTSTGKQIDDTDALTYKREVILALIPKYMTTGTGAVAAATTDAIADCIRLKAALDEILKL